MTNAYQWVQSVRNDQGFGVLLLEGRLWVGLTLWNGKWQCIHQPTFLDYIININIISKTGKSGFIR